MPEPAHTADAADATDLVQSVEQRELDELLGGLLARHGDSAAVRAAIGQPGGFDPALWRLLVEQVGVPALMVPEEHGGAGFTFAETAVALERLGYAFAPTPLPAGVLVVAALLLADDADASARLLPRVAEGAVATLGWSGPTSSPCVDRAAQPEPVRAFADGTLSGVLDIILDGDTAEVLLVLATTDDGLGLFEVAPDAPGLTRVHVDSMDQTLRLSRVDLDTVPATRIGGDLTDGAPVLQAVGSAVVSCLAVGAAQRGLDTTVAYSKERVQFGRPIGSFQALKQRMAEMLVAVETSRSAALDATLAVAAALGAPDGSDVDDLVRRTSVAKAWCTEALMDVAAETVQLHGGIAITWEHDAHLLLKRAHALGQLFGAAHHHRAVVLDPPEADPTSEHAGR
ncbi:acyl-CoA/acyl-ACP dehydrogenase [Nocardioides sp. HDW12B]|uniref:acyl-CoA dehydrogenase family protein n=1 Tax=Nocardioides sp. HDW12B TaxID=2714939 RepID=UPI00140987A9|nr:acyl-CoA dehydrogenase family protein [Nocardioides sp. HDW12B]QIK66244.1 acyl-CoA/acyl-ACP dehydrogenase [Nocardioides sp. HDW12B]